MRVHPIFYLFFTIGQSVFYRVANQLPVLTLQVSAAVTTSDRTLSPATPRTTSVAASRASEGCAATGANPGSGACIRSPKATPAASVSVGPFSVRSRSVLGPFSVRSRPVLGPFSARSRSVLGPFSARSRSVLGPFSVRSRSVLGPFSVRSRSVLGPFSVRSRSVLGPFPVVGRAARNLIKIPACKMCSRFMHTA